VRRQNPLDASSWGNYGYPVVLVLAESCISENSVDESVGDWRETDDGFCHASTSRFPIPRRPTGQYVLYNILTSRSLIPESFEAASP
jgi:hypothetical protein